MSIPNRRTHPHHAIERTVHSDGDKPWISILPNEDPVPSIIPLGFGVGSMSKMASNPEVFQSTHYLEATPTSEKIKELEVKFARGQIALNEVEWLKKVIHVLLSDLHGDKMRTSEAHTHLCFKELEQMPKISMEVKFVDQRRDAIEVATKPISIQPPISIQSEEGQPNDS